MSSIRILSWAALILAMSGDLFVSVALPVKYPGYSRMKDSISALGNPESPVRTVFNDWMLAEGLCFLAAMPFFFIYYRPLSLGLTITTVVFISVFAVGACILTCFFSVNKDKSEVTTASKIHGAGSVTGFMLYLFVPLMIALLSFKNKETFIGVSGIISFVLSLGTFALFVMADKPEFKNSFVANEGLWQRLNLFFMYLPLFMVSVARIMEHQ